VSYLSSDYTLQCFNDQWCVELDRLACLAESLPIVVTRNKYVGFAIFAVILYPGTSQRATNSRVRCLNSRLTFFCVVFGSGPSAGIPLFFFYLLYSNRRRLQKPDTIRNLGFLYEGERCKTQP
jgi:hypothetical protein